MKKNEAIQALTELAIPHDPEAKAGDLSGLAVAVNNAIAKAVEDGTGREIELQNMVAKLEEQLAAKSESAESPLQSKDEKFVQLVRAKMAAGLSKEQAISVVEAQIAHDEELDAESGDESDESSEPASE